MIAYFNPPNMVAAVAIARAFGLTVRDADGVERITSTHEGSAIFDRFGDEEVIVDGLPKLKTVRRLMIQAHTPARRAQLEARAGKTSFPRRHGV